VDADWVARLVAQAPNVCPRARRSEHGHKFTAIFRRDRGEGLAEMPMLASAPTADVRRLRVPNASAGHDTEDSRLALFESVRRLCHRPGKHRYHESEPKHKPAAVMVVMLRIIIWQYSRLLTIIQDYSGLFRIVLDNSGLFRTIGWQ